MTDRVLDLVAAHDERELAEMLLRAEGDLARLQRAFDAALVAGAGKFTAADMACINDSLAVSADPKAAK